MKLHPGQLWKDTVKADLRLPPPKKKKKTSQETCGALDQWTKGIEKQGNYIENSWYFMKKPNRQFVCVLWYMSVLPIYLRMTNSIERSASWEADSRSPHEEIPCLMWNARVHYDVHKSPPLVPILSYMNSSTPTYPISLSIPHQYLCVWSRLLHLGFPAKLFMWAYFLTSPFTKSLSLNCGKLSQSSELLLRSSSVSKSEELIVSINK